MSEILLKAGTGEVEVIDFVIKEQHYAINVLKIKEILNIREINQLPKSAETVAGIVNIRGNVSTVIDLKMVLHNEKTEINKDTLGVLCEFNETQVVFLVDRVEAIKRVSWEDIKPTNQTNNERVVIGTILDGDNIIVMLDFEAITLETQLGHGYEKQKVSVDQVQKNKHRGCKIVLAEDSRAIQEMLKCTLQEAGYTQLKMFSNGQEAKDYLFDLKAMYGEAYREHVDILVTDVEMPVLDGYTLTKTVKEDELLKNIKVVLFSSLITKELEHKGKAVGADIQISKPSMKILVEEIDRLQEQN